MSAQVEPFEIYNVFCQECNDGAGPFGRGDWAEEWAATHNAVHHESDNSDDEAYEKFKESRGI